MTKHKKKLPTRFFVVSDSDELSWCARMEAGEHFTSETAALRRANELANSEPGVTFFIAESVGYAKAEIVPAATHSLRVSP
jgi:hypothetical protein